MWLRFVSYVFVGGLISAEVITLIKDKEITCVLTDHSVNSSVYITNINGKEKLARVVKEIDDIFNDDWETGKSVQEFGPIFDQRWTSKERMYLDEKGTYTIGKGFSKSAKKTLKDKITLSSYLANKLTIYDSDNKTYTATLNSVKNDTEWEHYEIANEADTLLIKNLERKTDKIAIHDFRAKWITIPEDAYCKQHEYNYLYSNSSSTKELYRNVGSLSCIALYVSVDEGCYLNISLLPTNKVTKINGFNKKDQLKKWKKYEIRSEPNTIIQNISFYRGKDKNATQCFWAIDDLHSCSSEQVVYKMSLDKPWNNQICMELNRTLTSNTNCCGNSNYINCSEALGSSYFDCKEHKVCLSQNRCYCALGYKGKYCNETCVNNTWGLDCKENCPSNCDQCDPKTGCQKCKLKEYFGKNCTSKLPVLKKPPTLESIKNNSVTILVHFQYEKDEEHPDSYFIQWKKLNGTKTFQNYTTIQKWYENENISVEITNFTREYSYQFRVILVIKNESFQENTVPDLIVYKKSLHASVKNNYTMALKWTKPENHNDASYTILYKCSTICSNEAEEKSIITDKTEIELIMENQTTNCTFKLFVATNALEFIDQTTSKTHCQQTHSKTKLVQPTSSEKKYVITASVLSVTVLIVAIAGLIYCICKRRKFGQEKPEHTGPIKYSDFVENEALIDNNNKNNTSSKPIKINDFANFLLTSLDEDPDDNAITQQFQAVPRAREVDCIQGRLAENLEKNRYKNVLPYDNTRVVLVGNEDGDYINASYVNGYDTPKAFIATQNPLATTVHDFWHMIWQENVNIIAMLTEIEENERIKSEKYWPEQGARFKFSNYHIECISKKLTSQYVHRELQVIFNKQIRLIDHFQYKAWPDHGVPLYTAEFTAFLKNIIKLEKNTPTVVHCNTGCGRTGTFILCNILIKMAIKEKQLDFFGVLHQMRVQRAGLVSNMEQYIFSHYVVMEYFFGEDFSIPIGDTFEEELQNALKDCNIKRLRKSLKKARVQYERMKLKTTIQLTDEDKSKNRFSRILPGPSRIFLPVSSHKSSNYINAIAVDCYQYPKRFIVTQQPLPNTIVDFWNLVQEHDIDTILSLNKITDNDSSCPRFWPNNTDTWTLDTTTLAFFSEETDNNVYNLIRIKIGRTTEAITRNVIIKDVKNWNRKTKQPSNIKDLIYVWQKIRKCRGQVIVTCYDGATASGLFVAMAFLLEKINLDYACDVYSAVRTVRQSRAQFVDNIEQLKFLYHVALEYIREISTYRNFD